MVEEWRLAPLSSGRGEGRRQLLNLDAQHLFNVAQHLDIGSTGDNVDDDA